MYQEELNKCVSVWWRGTPTPLLPRTYVSIDVLMCQGQLYPFSISPRKSEIFGFQKYAPKNFQTLHPHYILTMECL